MAFVNLVIYARKNESNDRLIKRFNKKVRNSKLVEEVRERMFYEKPSVTKAKKKRQRRRVLNKLRDELKLKNG